MKCCFLNVDAKEKRVFEIEKFFFGGGGTRIA